MAEMKAKAVISAEDRTAGVFERIAARMGLINRAAAKANVMSVRASSTALAAQSRAVERADRNSAARVAVMGAAARVAAPIVGAAALKASVTQFAELDRRVTRIGITADASAPEVKGLAERLYQLGQSVALPTSDITTGLETLVAQGRNLKDSMEFLPSVAKTAAATGASVEDIAKSADSVGSNFKIAGKDMQSAFDIMAAGGKAGQFELKEMARYLPSLGPAAAAVGVKGKEGLADMVAMLQVLRKGSGTSEEAATSASNIFQKINSEETQKRFKKMGVDLEAGMKKGAKEGKSIITVFEELVQTATKGDLSKIPQLINDMEFARGIRALMTYRGEWQKLSAQIQKTSAGSVEIDLTRVQNDMQAKLDRLAEMVKHRGRQIGGFIADIVIPIDDKLKEIADGKNATFNKIDERAKFYNADAIANEELRTGAKHEFDPDTRRLVDARKEMVLRNKIDAERERIGGEVSRLDAERQAIVADAARQKSGTVLPWAKTAVDARTGAKLKPLDDRIAAAKESAGSFDGLVRRMDEINVLLAEGGKALTDAKSARIPNATTATRFDRKAPATTLFGLNGPVGSDPDWMPTLPGAPLSQRLPLARPDSLPKAPVSAEGLKAAFPAPDWALQPLKLDTSSLDFSNIEAKVVEPLTATVKDPVPLGPGTVSLDPGSKVDVSVSIKAEGATVTGMSATASGSTRASVGASMGHLATR